MLAPEYGGDGGKKIGICAERQGPVAFFPAHWAPNDMKIYLGIGFPKAYQGGAFLAFHGSWNRAPGPQGGYNVVFQPLADGKAAGPILCLPTALPVHQGSRSCSVPAVGAGGRSGRRAVHLG